MISNYRPANVNGKVTQDKIIEEEMDMEECFDQFSNSSIISLDYDDDDDDDEDIYNYPNTSFKQAAVEKSVPHLSSDIIATVESYNDTPMSINCTVAYDISDTESIEGNNRDPSSNLNSVQSFNKQLKPTALSQNDATSAQCSWRIKPYSNNNLQDLDKKIRKEAQQICNLLPACKYKSVYNILHTNCRAENRVELSLWDLLPVKRPRPKRLYDSSLPLKHLKQSDKQVSGLTHSVSNSTLNSDIASSSSGRGNRQSNCEKTMAELSAEGGVLRPANLIINDKSSHRGHVASRSSLTLALPKLTNITAKPLENEKATKSSTSVGKPENNTFINRERTSLGKNVFVSNSRQEKYGGQILHKYMEYLNFMKTVKKRKSTGEINDFDFNKRNETRRVFLGYNFFNVDQNIVKSINTKKKSNNAVKPSCINFSVPDKKRMLGGDVKRIALPFKFLQMYETLVVKFPHVDQYSIRQICKNLSKLENTSTMERLQTLTEHTLVALTDFAYLFASIKMCNPSTDATISAISDSSTSLRQVPLARVTSNNAVSNSNKLLSQSKLSASAATETNQVIGGARKKQMIQKEGSKSKKDAEKKNIFLPLKYELMYKTLESLYPELDKDIIRQTCKNVSKLEDICPFEKLQVLAEQTLQKKEAKLGEIDTSSLFQEEDENDQYLYLSGVFPNADPTYLKKVVARARDNPSVILDFIQTQWEKPTYPTKEEKLKKLQISQQQIQYIKKFDVKQFLEVLPDPCTFFKNPKRICKFNSEVIQFLKSQFDSIEDHRLRSIYEKNKYNLTLTVLELENLLPSTRLSQDVLQWKIYPPEDISLLQEYAFIIHRKEIVEYLNKLKETEIREITELKSRNALLECQCCFDKECIPSKCSTCDDGHIFCNSCILRGTESQLAEGVTRIACFSDCDGEFTIPTLQKILPPTQFSIFIRKKQEMEVMAAGVEGLVSCPFCHFASIPPPGDKVFKCLNPECMKESCRLCKEPNHVPLRCYEEKSDQARLLLEEKMTEALVRKCYRCSRPYFKVDGCNKITCVCGATMCYICDTAIDGYSHFGPSGCPQMSDNHNINDGTVREVALKTMEFIKKKEPNVTINAEDLLKDLPSTSNDGIQGRVNKIARF